MKSLPIDSSSAGVYPKRHMELGSIALALAVTGTGPAFPSSPDIVCRDKSDKTVFSAHINPTDGQSIREMKKGKAIITGFPELNVDQNDLVMVIDEPASSMVNEDVPHVEITIDRTNGLGRFSAVDDKSQIPACAACQEATEIDCNEKPR